MADEAILTQISGPGIAAFALCRVVFWQAVDCGLFSKDEAKQRLRDAVEANENGGPGNELAAQLLALILTDLETRPAVVRQ